MELATFFLKFFISLRKAFSVNAYSSVPRRPFCPFSCSGELLFLLWVKPLPVVGDYGSYTFISVQHGVLWTFFFSFLDERREETRKKRGGWYTAAVPRLFLPFLRIFFLFFFFLQKTILQCLSFCIKDGRLSHLVARGLWSERLGCGNFHSETLVIGSFRWPVGSKQ